MIDEQSHESGHDYALDRSPIGAGVSAGVSSMYVRYGDERESVRLFDAPGRSEATNPIQDVLHEVYYELVNPRQIASFSGDAT